jgi:large subunit ribosomal protein L11
VNEVGRENSLVSKIKVLVDGGNASAGPPLGPALGPLGVNVGQVVAKINQETAPFAGMKVPVTVIVDPKTKKFEVEVGSPPVSALIKKELGLEKGAKTTGSEVVGNLSLAHVAKIAKLKITGSFARSLKAAVKEVLGTCVSSGITVNGKDPREVQREIDEGKHDEPLNRWETEEIKPDELPKLEKPPEKKPEEEVEKPPEEEPTGEKPKEKVKEPEEEAEESSKEKEARGRR